VGGWVGGCVGGQVGPVLGPRTRIMPCGIQQRCRSVHGWLGGQQAGASAGRERSTATAAPAGAAHRLLTPPPFWNPSLTSSPLSSSDLHSFPPLALRSYPSAAPPSFTLSTLSLSTPSKSTYPPSLPPLLCLHI
jgi:hypothetical protein